MQPYIEFLIQFGSTGTKLLTIPEPVPVHLRLDHIITTNDTAWLLKKQMCANNLPRLPSVEHIKDLMG